MFPLPSHPSLTKDLLSLKGVGPHLKRILNKRGFQCVGDLVALMPSRYQDRRTLVPLGRLKADSEVLTGGYVDKISPKRSNKTGRHFFEITISDDTGQVQAYWFRFPVYLRRTMKKGDRVLLFGQVKEYRNRLYFPHPEMTLWRSEDPPVKEIRPVYPAWEDIKPGVLRRIMAQAARELSAVPTIFPRTWLDNHHLTDPVISLLTLHQPPVKKPGRLPRPEDSLAWKSLALFELLFIQLTLARIRARLNHEQGIPFNFPSELVDRYLSGLPFELTFSQALVLKDIQGDMAAPRPMNRLLQGDVGSGKTVLAIAAALAAIDTGYQVAFMAPTEILAQQHYQNFISHAERLDVTTDLLVGSLTETEKSLSQENLASGKTQLVFGTHALFSKAVQFKSLGLVIIDEQHRFGVAQRLALKSKGEQPDFLIMTATPIPRSLAMTLYGDLDLSVIHGLPPGRHPIETKLYAPKDRLKAYQELSREIMDGGQAFVVAPRIGSREENTDQFEDLSAAENLFRVISNELLPQVKIGLVHGRMKTEQQQAMLKSFREGHVKVLVATTVIEVGMDLANATMILVEGAERFGLAQLHQLRGRVGRGPKPAQCLLIGGSSEGHSDKRLRTLTQLHDGFTLAEEDLKIRGPGETTGFKQSGLPALSWARLPQDLPVLVQARDLALEIIASDPALQTPDFRLVREVIDQMEKRIQGELIKAG